MNENNMNVDLGDLGLSTGDTAAPAAPAAPTVNKGGKKTAEPVAPAPPEPPIPAVQDPPPPEPPIDEEEDEEEAAAPAPPTAEPRVTIIIDEVQGMSNYEFVGVNGVNYKIKRGVPVEVPMSVVNVLRVAVTTHTEITMDQLTGERRTKEYNRSAIPWRIV